jgi:hypothetical protein
MGLHFTPYFLLLKAISNKECEYTKNQVKEGCNLLKTIVKLTSLPIPKQITSRVTKKFISPSSNSFIATHCQHIMDTMNTFLNTSSF